MIGFTKLLTGKATVAAAVRAADCGAVPPHLLQFSTASRPIVVWNLTWKCNLQCRHCYLEASPSSQGEELSTADALQLITEFGEMKTPVIIFSGGEPLLYAGLWELAEHARSQGIRTALSTNGILITPDVARKLNSCGFAYVGVSLDGGPSVHDTFRGASGAFEKTLNGLRNAKEAGLKTGIRFTVNKNNIQDLPLIFDLVKNEKIPRFCLYHLVYAGRGRDLASIDLTIQEKRELVDYLIQKAIEFHKEGIEAEILTTDHHADGIYLYRWVKENLPERAQEVEQLLEFHGGCSAGVKIANIDPQGYVYPCQFWRSSSLGKVPERSFREIWYDENNQLLKALRNKEAHLKGKCGECKHNSLCGGCRIRAEAVNDDIWGEDPVCYLSNEEIGKA